MVHSVGFDRCVRTCVDCDRSTWNSFGAVNILSSDHAPPSARCLLCTLPRALGSLGHTPDPRSSELCSRENRGAPALRGSWLRAVRTSPLVPQVQRRTARGWCSWWICGIRTSLRLNGRPWTSSSLPADETFPALGLARVAWGRPGQTCSPAPAVSRLHAQNLPPQRALTWGVCSTWGPAFLSSSLWEIRGLCFLRSFSFCSPAPAIRLCPPVCSFAVTGGAVPAVCHVPPWFSVL